MSDINVVKNACSCTSTSPHESCSTEITLSYKEGNTVTRNRRFLHSARIRTFCCFHDSEQKTEAKERSGIDCLTFSALRILFFRDMTLRRWVNCYRRFERM
jgi:hypothetical protein